MVIFFELGSIFSSRCKWLDFDFISLQKCSCSAATLRFLHLIKSKSNSFSLANKKVSPIS